MPNERLHTHATDSDAALAADLLELMRRRRTARSYLPAAPAPEDVRHVLEAARWAPSAANRQPWELIVIDDEAIKRRLVEIFLQDAAGRGKSYQTVTLKQAAVLRAPVLIAVCGDPHTKERFIQAEEIPEQNREELFLLSMGAVIQNLLLAAASLGLATTWLARIARIPAVAELLAIPSEVRLLSFVALGRSDQPAAWDESLRIPVVQKTHWNRFGTAAMDMPRREPSA